VLRILAYGPQDYQLPQVWTCFCELVVLLSTYKCLQSLLLPQSLEKRSQAGAFRISSLCATFPTDLERRNQTYEAEVILSPSEAVLTRIDLSVAPDVIFLFGLAGAGKNFVGDLLSRHSGRLVYHADTDIPESMRHAIAQKKNFTDQMRDEFFEVIRHKVLELQGKHRQLIITQAAYKQRHRDFIRQHIPGVQFVHVTADDVVIAQRLQRRGDWISPEYAAQMRAQFEAPSVQYPEIVNNGTTTEVLRQIGGLFQAKKGRKALAATNSE